MANDHGSGHCHPVSTERFEWMVWGGLCAHVSRDECTRRPADIRYALAGMVPDEATARAALECARIAGEYDRVGAALRYLQEREKLRLEQVRRHDTMPAPAPEGCK